MTLPFDGSSLGEHEFSVITWLWPCNQHTSGTKTAVFYALITIDHQPHPVILKRNCSARRDQCVIDELKPVFGLSKMGTHQIRLHGVPTRQVSTLPWISGNIYLHPQWSDYLLFRARTHIDNGNVIFSIPQPLTKEDWDFLNSNTCRDEHKRFYYEVQKIFVFRELLRVSDTSESNVLAKEDDNGKLHPVSIDEMKMNGPGEPHRKLSPTREQFYFPRIMERTEVLIRMLGLHKETYPEQLERLGNSISRIIQRVDSEKMWMTNVIIDEITNQLSIYYSMKEI